MRIRLDELPIAELCRVLAILNRSSRQFGYETALQSLQEALRRGTVNRHSVQTVAARIAWDGLHSVPDGGPNLQACDQVLLETKEARL